MKVSRVALLVVVVLALVLIAVALLRPRRASSSLRCVESSTVGSLEVTDFDNPWGYKALGAASWIWNVRPDNPHAALERQQRDTAVRTIGLLDQPPWPNSGTPEVGAVRFTATCDGEVHVLQVYAPLGPQHLSECRTWSCARLWLRDRYRGANSNVQTVVDEAYAQDSLRRAE